MLEAVHSRHGETDENADDHQHHEELDQREPETTTR